jgi:hypothetical protein
MVTEDQKLIIIRCPPKLLRTGNPGHGDDYGSVEGSIYGVMRGVRLYLI